jgi:AcrR family transcriptional regulator
MIQASDWRQRRHQATMEEIKETARQQIAEDGAANLSLGVIARTMGMTPPALYRYFENRDALVVALIVDAYNSMGEAMEASLAGLPEGDHAGRFVALMRAYRQWAVEHPEDYALMYALATGVVMVGEQVQEFQRAVMRSMRAMVQVLSSAQDAGQLIIPAQYNEPPQPVRQALSWMRLVLQEEDLRLSILALTLTTWLRADALVWQELHGHLPKALFGAGDFYEMESRVLAERLGLVD